MMIVPLEHGYGAWENKEKVHNGDHGDSDDKDLRLAEANTQGQQWLP
jgi:hypothetical protein